MAKNKPPTSWDEIRKKIKNIKTEMIIIHIATIIIGMFMVAIPNSINSLICQTIGILLCIWGVIRIISYLRAKAENIFGSFGLVQGGAMLGFGIFFLVNSDFFVKFIDMALAIILLVTAVIKLQYAFDFLKLESPRWWIHLIGAVIIAVLGILALTKPFGVANIIMVFIGCGLIFSGIWDLVSVLYMSNTIKNTINGIKKKVKEQDRYVEVIADEDKN